MNFRRHFCTLGAIAALASMAATSPGQAETRVVRIAKQFGISYLPLTIMEQKKLLEAEGKKQGLDLSTEWLKFTGGPPMNEALVSGNLDFASGGVGPLVTVWARTQNNIKVKGIASLNSMPLYLNTINPNVKTIKDFTDKDRISLAGAGSSVQTIYLQMAVAKEYGIENYKKLNPLMVKLTHPEGMRALLSGQGEITAQFTSPPFQNMELEHPNIHVVLNSYDVMGGPNTFLMLWATDKFRKENPKTYKAVMAALHEATDSINADKKRAAEIYSEEGGGKEKVDFLLKIMEDPQVHYTLAPERILPYAQFMHKVGIIKHEPKSWKDLFFPEVYDQPGS